MQESKSDESNLTNYKVNKIDDLELLCIGLQRDLAREYAHWHFYMYAASAVTGLHREEYREFFEKEAAGEMQHIKEFSDLILGLGGSLVVIPDDFPHHSTNARDLLQEALALEEAVCSNFVDRMDQAEKLEQFSEHKVSARYVQIFLEDQLMDSRSTVDHLKRILKDAN